MDTVRPVVCLCHQSLSYDMCMWLPVNRIVLVFSSVFVIFLLMNATLFLLAQYTFRRGFFV